MSAAQQVTDFVTQVLKQMGLALEATVETTQDGTRINLEGEGGEALLARRGEGLQALQHIVDSAFRKQLGDQRLLIDCMNFRRGKDNELCLNDGSVSKIHAALTMNVQGTLLVADTGSTNGTFINGRRIAYGEARQIEEGDVVGFGDVEVRIRKVE